MMATEPGSITTVLRRGASCALQKPEQRFSVASVPQYPSKALDWATCLVVEVEVRGNCTRCVVTRTVKYNMIGCLWVHSAFVGRGDAAFCVKALGKFSSERMSCEEAEKGRLSFPCWFLVLLRLSNCSKALAWLSIRGSS
jgi:hypothetical protein